jgi:oligopeptide/dipeptide ABC transporter, ATP-binding protein, C-terminal domain
MKEQLLSVEDLNIKFHTSRGTVHAVQDLSFRINEKETLGIVGESGSGKSVTSLSIMGLLPEKITEIAGEVLFEGVDLLGMSERQKRAYRGNYMSMIFQEPMTSLNPLHTCGKQIMEPILVHQKVSKAEAKERALELLKLTGIPAPEQRFHEYPHQMSGGMRQRIMIAMALACNPKLLIADEPTTALDVTIQAQILELLKELKKTQNMGIIMITHDLGIVSEMCDRVIVMYTGQVVEQGPIRDIMERPLHPYTQGLIAAIPQIGEMKEKLQNIEGMVPSLNDMPEGCSFHPRCPHAMEVCKKKYPELISVEEGRQVRCFRCMAQGEGDVIHGRDK